MNTYHVRLICSDDKCCQNLKVRYVARGIVVNKTHNYINLKIMKRHEKFVHVLATFKVYSLSWVSSHKKVHISQMHPFQSCSKMFLYTKGPWIKETLFVNVFAEFLSCLYRRNWSVLKRKQFFFSSRDKAFKVRYHCFKHTQVTSLLQFTFYKRHWSCYHKGTIYRGSVGNN